MRINIFLLALGFTIFSFKSIFGQEVLPASNLHSDTIELYLNFPVFDLPYQIGASQTTGSFLSAYANPSMELSEAISSDLYSSAHWFLKKSIKFKSEFLSILLQNSAAASFDFITLSTPLGAGWLHEEFHRAVMTRRGVNSFNDINTFPFGEEIVAVRKIKDADLRNIFDNHNADYRRLTVAGIEGQYAQIRSLQKQNFYYNQELPNIPLYWISTMNSIFYVIQSSSSDFNSLVDEVNELEADDIEKRDFVGPDFTGWAYALFNSGGKYEDRGVHPSGLGINRYIKPDQLSTEARSYLTRQGNLQFINLISPHLFGFTKIRINNSQHISFALRHLLTPFGNDIGLDLFYQNDGTNYFLALHNYNNLNSSFGGLEFAIIDKAIFQNKILCTINSMLWVQPENQSFRTDKGQLGGLISIKGSYGIGKGFYCYLKSSAKSAGWAMGNVFLENNFSTSLGTRISIVI